MADFRQRLTTGAPIVADGGMGALLSGVAAGLRCPEEANIVAPESVVARHARRYSPTEVGVQLSVNFCQACPVRDVT